MTVVVAGSIYPVETLEYDGAVWRSVVGNPVVNPPARDFPSTAYDRVRGRVVLFAGSVGYDESRNRFVVFDGSLPSTRGAVGDLDRVRSGMRSCRGPSPYSVPPPRLPSPKHADD